MAKEIEVKILSVLKDCSMTKAEIEQGIEAKDSETGNTLQNLKGRGQVELTAGKRWQITEEGKKRLDREKEAGEKGKSELTKAEKERIAIKRYNEGVHPTKVAEEIGDVDLATEIHEKWKRLNLDDYSQSLKLLEEKSCIKLDKYTYSPGPVFYGLSKVMEENEWYIKIIGNHLKNAIGLK